MRFSHLADIHIGAWRDERMRSLSMQAFSQAISRSVAQRVDFMIISGDLFNTSFPSIDHLNFVVQELKALKDKGIPVYCIAGSHDFSPSGRSIIDVLENAGLLKNVMKGKVEDGSFRLDFTKDPKTGAKLAGISGRAGMLDRSYYMQLDKASLEKEPGFRIFLFHIALSELKPEELGMMASADASILPKGFDYYAGGHVHIVGEASFGSYKNVVYPGPTFPVNFRELEALGNGGFYLFEDGKARFEALKLKSTAKLFVDCSSKTPEKVESELSEMIQKGDFSDKIVLLRLAGKLSGKTSDIPLKEMLEGIWNKGAYFIMKNTAKLSSEELLDADIVHDQDIEGALIDKYSSDEGEKSLIRQMLEVLSIDKDEDEKRTEYEEKVLKASEKAIRSFLSQG